MSKTFTNKEIFGKPALQEFGVKGMKWGSKKADSGMAQPTTMSRGFRPSAGKKRLGAVAKTAARMALKYGGTSKDYARVAGDKGVQSSMRPKSVSTKGWSNRKFANYLMKKY